MDQALQVDLPAALAAVRLCGPDGAPCDGDAGTGASPAPGDLEAERAGLARARHALERAAAKIADLHQAVLAECEDHLLDLAIDVARKVIAQEVQAGRHDIEPIVREALRLAPPKREVVVHLNPEDLAAAEDAGNGRPGGTLKHLHLAADASLGRGECIVETAEGTVEARIDDQLAHLHRIMTDPETP